MFTVKPVISGKKLCKAFATAPTCSVAEQRKIYFGAFCFSDLFTWPKSSSPAAYVFFFLQRPLPEAQMRQAGVSAQQDQSQPKSRAQGKKLGWR